MNLTDETGHVDIEIRCNVDDGEIISNVEASLTRGLPEFSPVDAHEGTACIVGGAPSLKACLDELRLRKRSGQAIFAVNGAGRYLSENGIEPDAVWMVDARESNAGFAFETDAEWFIASQCHPAVFEVLKGQKVTLWHDLNCAAILPDGVPMIGGGTTIGMKALSGAFLLGYRHIHLFGFDSSYDKTHHAYEQPQNDGEPVQEIWVRGRSFLSANWMIRQVADFTEIATDIAERGGEIEVHGTGLLPTVAMAMAGTLEAPQEALQAVYDLSVAPPTYDFLSFLMGAERERIRKGFDLIDVTFQPGPKGGFRDDDLPPDVETRRKMLGKICVAACLLLPSVRKIDVLENRTPVEGALYPDGWEIDKPVRRYGLSLVKEGLPSALVGTVPMSGSYVTITLRESSYWPERNSKFAVWDKVASILESRGLDVVMVPDTENPREDSFIEASHDLDVRLSLYQGALCNLMIANGPVDLARFGAAPHIVFRPVTPECPSTTEDFLAANGVHRGDQLSPHGLIAWEARETPEDIIATLDTYLTPSQTRTIEHV